MEITAPPTKHASPTKAIPIPGKSKTASIKDIDEYSLTLNNFDPNKFSPPSSWNNRLRARIGDDSKFSAYFSTKSS